MGKIKNPVNFSTQFNLSTTDIEKIGVVDIILNADTNLFIDPLLLEGSSIEEISKSAYARYCKHFETIIKLLAASKVEGDLAWKNAKRHFQFHEVSWTCLGYGGTTGGSGFGPELIDSTLKTAKEIVELGITDFELFMALALFEEGIGPDRISDMTTNIILTDLCSFNERIITELGLKTDIHEVNGKSYNLLTNPYSKKKDPILLVPKDIVRDLPIASDWSDISRVVNHNHALRNQVNNHLGEVLSNMSKQDKAQLKESALKSKEAFEVTLEMLRQSKGVPYDIVTDINGEIFWANLITLISNKFPKDLSKYQKIKLDKDTVYKIVGEIIEQFQFLMEQRDLWREMWDESLSKHKKEKAAQRLFFAVAYSYCKSNNLDLTPEAETGNGPVDFKISSGFEGKVIVEIKLSSNTRLAHGYAKQLEIYRDAEETDAAYFLVIDVGNLGQKAERLFTLQHQQTKQGHNVSQIYFVDALPRDSASVRD